MKNTISLNEAMYLNSELCKNDELSESEPIGDLNALLSDQIYFCGKPLSQIAKDLGFEICEWKPEPQDQCEDCGKENVQMWFAGDGWGEGCYSCLGCIISMHKENHDAHERIKTLESEGHQYHCVYRQVFGDGECECDLYEKGYDPYDWLSGGHFPR